jgi:filamentous hemagglutinin family protein
MRYFIYSGFTTLVTLTLAVNPVQAQSITPAAGGTNTTVNFNNNQYDISGGQTSSNGTNLFQSFNQFGLKTGETANFLTNPNIQNILGKVVGGDASVINGLIRVIGSNANLYLINPAGIIFGNNASLNVPASFTATTADRIGFGDKWLNVFSSNNYAELIGNPQSFAFTTLQPGSIVNTGNLAVSGGANLNLIGGTVINTGQLSAPEGQIIVTSVPGENVVRLSQPGSVLSLEIQLFNDGQTNFTSSSLPQLLTGAAVQNATNITVNNDGTIQLTGSGLSVAPETGMTINSGNINVAGDKGGTIGIFGEKVGLMGGNINASGTNGGGTVLIGGEYKGQGSVPNAQITYFGQDAQINADSLVKGDGGRVIVWADDTTRFYGNITARGGTQSGNGGFVETSGKQSLQAIGGFVDVSASQGQPGTWLLDPRNVIITNQTTTGVNQSGGVFTPIQDDAIINIDDLVKALESGSNVTVITGTDGQQQGDIRLNAPLTMKTLGLGTVTLTLEAINNIFIDSSISSPVGGTRLNLTLNAGANININNNISTGGGNLVFNASNDIFITQVISTNGGNFTSNNGGNFINNNASIEGLNISTLAGDVFITSNGDVTLGNIITTGNAFNPSGGDIFISSSGNITLGDFVTSSAGSQDPDSGIVVGNITLNATGNIEVGLLEARSYDSFASDGVIDITAGNLLKVSPASITGELASYSIYGNKITIRHGGGALGIPFVVSDGMSPVSDNGTANNITTGNDTIQNQSFLNSYTQGNIQIITTTPPVQTPVEPVEPPVQTPVEPVESPVQTPVEPIVKLPITEVPVDRTPIINIETQQAIATDLEGEAKQEITSETTEQNIKISPNLATISQFDFGRNLVEIETGLTNEFNNYFNLPEETRKFNISNLRQSLRQIEGRTGVKPAIIYLLFEPAPVATKQDESTLELILVTSQGQPIRKRINGVTKAEVLKVAKSFLSQVTDPDRVRSKSYLQSAQKLYSWLIAPLQADLQANNIKNLTFVADQGLRFVPLAALHDGQQFLVEKYSVGLMPSVSLTDTTYKDVRKDKVLAMGASQFTDLQPLPAVPVELRTITQKLWTGEYFLNQNFTLENIKSQRRLRPYAIVHLATHGEFKPGNVSNSYIQLWDKKLQLDQIRELGWNNPPVELLVLSACRTALGSDEAELGFAGLAVQAGVKSAIASLWYVSDEGTLALMTQLYNRLKTAPIKAEALRNAQISMIKGDVSIQDGKLISPVGEINLPDSITVRDNSNFSHPYYWSSFTMIGNPW